MLYVPCHWWPWWKYGRPKWRGRAPLAPSGVRRGADTDRPTCWVAHQGRSSDGGGQSLRCTVPPGSATQVRTSLSTRIKYNGMSIPQLTDTFMAATIRPTITVLMDLYRKWPANNKNTYVVSPIKVWDPHTFIFLINVPIFIIIFISDKLKAILTYIRGSYLEYKWIRNQLLPTLWIINSCWLTVVPFPRAIWERNESGPVLSFSIWEMADLSYWRERGEGGRGNNGLKGTILDGDARLQWSPFPPAAWKFSFHPFPPLLLQFDHSALPFSLFLEFIFLGHFPSEKKNV